MLANRLKQILPDIISPTQSAFVPGHLITNNVLVAYETLHTMHTRKKGRKGSLAFKLDISKVYDWVEWPFLQEIMSKFDFPEKLIGWVMGCVTTPSFSILINGNHMATSSQLEVFHKVIHFHHTCSFCVHRDSLHY